MNLMAPLSINQHNYLQKTFDSWFNVAEGGKRGGKNVLNSLAFAMCLEEHPDKYHLIAGVSIGTAKMNIIQCDGYGLLNFFEGRCRQGVHENKGALFIQTRTGEKIVIIAGGRKSGDDAHIKGLTFGSAYITEANECHLDFLQEVFDRTLTSKRRKIFHDLNPKGEMHYYYTDLLNKHEEKQKKNPLYGYNYGKFTLADNMSMGQEQINEILGTYDKKSLWFLRDILGQRQLAEGLVYSMFRQKLHVVKTIERDYANYVVVNDFGTDHPLVFQLFGLSDGVWYLVNEFYHNGAKEGQKTNDEYYEDLIRFCGDRYISLYIRDNAPVASSFNVMLKKKRYFPSIKNANNEVLSGIQEVTTALVRGKLKINDCCKHTIGEFGLYSWDRKAKEDKPLKENDDCLDCLRYFVKTMKITQEKKDFFTGKKIY